MLAHLPIRLRVHVYRYAVPVHFGPADEEFGDGACLLASEGFPRTARPFAELGDLEDASLVGANLIEPESALEGALLLRPAYPFAGASAEDGEACFVATRLSVTGFATLEATSIVFCRSDWERHAPAILAHMAEAGSHVFADLTEQAGAEGGAAARLTVPNPASREDARAMPGAFELLKGLAAGGWHGFGRADFDSRSHFLAALGDLVSLFPEGLRFDLAAAIGLLTRQEGMVLQYFAGRRCERAPWRETYLALPGAKGKADRDGVDESVVDGEAVCRRLAAPSGGGERLGVQGAHARGMRDYAPILQRAGIAVRLPAKAVADNLAFSPALTGLGASLSGVIRRDWLEAAADLLERMCEEPVARAAIAGELEAAFSADLAIWAETVGRAVESEEGALGALQSVEAADRLLALANALDGASLLPHLAATMRERAMMALNALLSARVLLAPDELKRLRERDDASTAVAAMIADGDTELFFMIGTSLSVAAFSNPDGREWIGALAGQLLADPMPAGQWALALMSGRWPQRALEALMAEPSRLSPGVLFSAADAIVKALAETGQTAAIVTHVCQLADVLPQDRAALNDAETVSDLALRLRLMHILTGAADQAVRTAGAATEAIRPQLEIARLAT